MSDITLVSKMRRLNTSASSLDSSQCSIQNVQANCTHPHLSISDRLGLQSQQQKQHNNRHSSTSTALRLLVDGSTMSSLRGSERLILALFVHQCTIQ